MGEPGRGAHMDRFAMMSKHFDVNLSRVGGVLMSPDGHTPCPQRLLLICGFLGTPKNIHSSHHYGNMIVHLRKENVRDRTTYSVGNSLGHQGLCCPCSDPDSRLITLDNGRRPIATHPIDSQCTYIELQYHEELYLSDVEKIVHEGAITLENAKWMFRLCAARNIKFECERPSAAAEPKRIRKWGASVASHLAPDTRSRMWRGFASRLTRSANVFFYININSRCLWTTSLPNNLRNNLNNSKNNKEW